MSDAYAIDTSPDTDAFVSGYVECALWSSSWYGPDADPEATEPRPMDDYFEPDGLTAETMAAIVAECEEFIGCNLVDLTLYVEHVGDWSQAGFDFWLTRNGHGAGYWDRGYREPAEVNDALDRLTADSHTYGELDPDSEWVFTRNAEECARLAWEDS